MNQGILAIVLSFGLLSSVRAMNDHDSLVQLSQQANYNSQRIDKHDQALEKNAAKLNEIANEVSSIKAFGIGITAIGSIQVIVQLVMLNSTNRRRQKIKSEEGED